MKDVTATEKRVGVDGTVEHVSLPRIRLVGFLSLVISLSLVIFDQLRAMPRMMETTRTSEIKESIHISRIKGLTIEVASTPAVPRPILPLSDLDLHGNCIPVQDRRPLLPPLEMLKIYISQHSEQSLWRDWEANNTHHRRFAIVHYSCPQQLGNRLHHFYNDFLLAFLSNRTILWKYWDRDSCVQLGNKYDHEICTDQNRTLSIDDSAQACGSILETAAWMARYDIWSRRLHLPEPVQIWVRAINQHNAPHPPPPGVERLPWVDETNSDDGTSDIGVSSQWKIAVFQPLVGVLGPGFVKKHLTQNIPALSRVQALFAYGAEFWHGALFDHAFRWQSDFLESIQPLYSLAQDHVDPTLSALSIALHSRHTDPLDDGSNVTNEIKCLERLIREMKLLKLTQCRVFIMSDRPQTLTTLQNWLEESTVSCEVIQAKHDQEFQESGLEVEHGPFAGAGFVQDLELASREASRSLNAVWVGHARSSSKLLLEWLTYRRAIRFWKDYGLEPSGLPKMSTCQLPG